MNWDSIIAIVGIYLTLSVVVVTALCGAISRGKQEPDAETIDRIVRRTQDAA